MGRVQTLQSWYRVGLIVRILRNLFTVLIVGVLIAGCATTNVSRNVTPEVKLDKAFTELPEEQLLDVWIELFDPGELPEKEKDALGLYPEIRAAEARFMPAHLRQVMEKTGYWGAVRVVPRDTEGAEVLVGGVIKASDGETLEIEITAQDATGRRWFKRIYRHDIKDISKKYNNQHEDSFEPVYYEIANDLAEFRTSLSDEDRTRVRQVAEMRFAADMLPDGFSDHLQMDDQGIYVLVRLPAEDDPAYHRVQIIRDRDFQLIDTLNGYYENFYRDLEIPYQEWRKARNIEAEALREAKSKAANRKALGALAILGAIAIEVLGSSNTRATTRTARDVMVLGGAYSIKKGMDISSESNIHRAAIEELGESFVSEARPLVIEVEGETLELKGSAEAQYKQWRELMRKIYASETGLEPVSSGTY